MSLTTRRRPARLALLTAAAVAAGTLGLVPSPAQAEQTGQPIADSGDLTWEVSQLLGASRMGFPAPQPDKYVAPASYNSPLSTWAGGAGTVAADGSADLTFEGASVHWATTGNAWMRIADLGVEIDADGAGQVTADVAYGTTTSSTWSTATTVRAAEDLTIVNLSADPGAGDANYPASYSALEYEFAAPADEYVWNNVRGRWSDEFLGFLDGDPGADPAVPAYVYASTVSNSVGASGSTAGVSRYPSPFVISIDRAEAGTSATLGAATATGVPLEVEGTGFEKSFPGVYVSVREAEAGAPPYTGGAVQADAPTAWASNSATDLEGSDPMTRASAVIGDDGSFDLALPLTPEFIESVDETKTYSLVTRKAHGMGGLPAHADQVTETALDLSGLVALADDNELTTVTATVENAVVGATTAEVTVAAESGAPTGTVTVKEGETVLGTRPLAGGKASVPLAALGAGEHELTVEFSGAEGFWASTDSASVTVAKSPSAASISAAASTYGQPATVVVNVPGRSGAVTLTGTGTALASPLSAGRATFTLPAALAPKVYSLSATYAGDADHEGVTATGVLTVNEAKPTVKASWKKRPTVRKAGRLVAVVAGPEAVAAPTGEVKAQLVKGKKKVAVEAVPLKGGEVALKVPSLAKGKWKVTVTYVGDTNYASAKKKLTLKVTR